MTDKPLDRIHIRELRARCIVGIYPEERKKKQDVILQVTIHADLSRPCKTDEIGDSIDYKTIKKRVLVLVEDSSYRLIEALAQGVAEAIFEAAPKAERVDVTVDKPGALRFARSVAVEISRFRDDSLD